MSLVLQMRLWILPTSLSPLFLSLSFFFFFFLPRLPTSQFRFFFSCPCQPTVKHCQVRSIVFNLYLLACIICGLSLVAVAVNSQPLSNPVYLIPNLYLLACIICVISRLSLVLVAVNSQPLSNPSLSSSSTTTCLLVRPYWLWFVSSRCRWM